MQIFYNRSVYSLPATKDPMTKDLFSARFTFCGSCNMWAPTRIRRLFNAGSVKCVSIIASNHQCQDRRFISALVFDSHRRKECFSSGVVPLSSMNHPPVNITLYQYAICPFCNRVKTILDYIGNDVLKVQHVEVNPLTKSEIQPWKKLYRKVPIATLHEEAIFGSDEIIQKILELPVVRSSLEQRWSASTTGTSPMTWEQFTTSNQEWVDFSSKELAVWLYPNMCRTWKDSYRAFEYVHDKQFSMMQRFLIQNIGSLVRILSRFVVFCKIFPQPIVL
jgi:glutaredoxin